MIRNIWKPGLVGKRRETSWSFSVGFPVQSPTLVHSVQVWTPMEQINPIRSHLSLQPSEPSHTRLYLAKQCWHMLAPGLSNQILNPMTPVEEKQCCLFRGDFLSFPAAVLKLSIFTLHMFQCDNLWSPVSLACDTFVTMCRNMLQSCSLRSLRSLRCRMPPVYTPRVFLAEMSQVTGTHQLLLLTVEVDQGAS